MLVATRGAQVKSFTYAASSLTYGDHPALPKVEENMGKPLSPYAVTKYVHGLYAAVIPKWTAAMIQGEEPVYQWRWRNQS